MIQRSLNDRMIDIDETITEDTSYLMNYPCNGFTVQVTPTGGTVSVSTSNDGENFVTWGNGNVSVSTIDRVYPVEYIKVDLVTATSVRVAIRGY